MSRSHASQQHSVFRATLPVVLAGLLVLSALPVRFLGWTDGLGHLLATVLAPVSHPMVVVSTWLAPADRGGAAGGLAGNGRLTGDAAELAEQVRVLEQAWLREIEENRRLRARLDELQAGRAFNEEIRVRLGAYPVIGSSSDPTSAAMRVRAGSGDGVTVRSTVATTAGTQLVGRVIDVGSSVSTVVPITDPGAGESLDCIVLPGGELDPSADVRGQGHPLPAVPDGGGAAPR
ncbi:MAG: rod shape-determining protein MreC [Planctomycetota bacterium]